ncbi:MAG: transposase [Solirubrobacterales bacterium]
MPDYTLHTWIARHIRVRQRLQRVCAGYLLFLMVVTTKHTLEEAARFSGLHKSQFSKMLKGHGNIASDTLDSLSTQQAKRLSKSLNALKGLPWKIVIIIDSTLQNRASLHPENSKKFNHGQGFVIGHQWTNIVLIINEVLIPLRPIPFYSKRYCVDHGREYRTEHDLVVEYIATLNLADYIGSYNPRDVLVLTDSGYDNKKIENAIADKHWTFIMALGKTRSVKSETLYLTTSKSKQWSHVATFFRNHRRLKWTTIRLMTNGAKAKRMEFRIRHTIGYLRYVGRVQLVCSEPKKRPEGRRRYLACNDVKVTARQIMMGYRLRWAVELFHKNIKQHLGFEDVATSGFDSVMAHVYWVYCAYILLHMSPPGVAAEVKSLGGKQRQLQSFLETKEKRRILQKLTQIGGMQRYKDELRQALADV